MATEGDNGTASTEEATVNAAAAAEQAATTATETVVETPAQETTASPTGKTAAAEQPAFDAQKQYVALEKSYKELQGKFTQTAQERSAASKELTAIRETQSKLLEMIQKATEAPFDPEQFKNELFTKGPQALEGWLEKKLQARLQSVQEKYDKDIESNKQENLALRTRYEVAARHANSEDYPNFAELYPKMLDLAKDPKCPVDFSKPVEESLDALYNLAKVQSSDEAVKIAAERGKKQAEAEAARESQTTVATSGRRGSSTSPNLETMPLGDLEKLVIQQHGIADRD